MQTPSAFRDYTVEDRLRPSAIQGPRTVAMIFRARAQRNLITVFKLAPKRNPNIAYSRVTVTGQDRNGRDCN